MLVNILKPCLFKAYLALFITAIEFQSFSVDLFQVYINCFLIFNKVF